MPEEGAATPDGGRDITAAAAGSPASGSVAPEAPDPLTTVPVSTSVSEEDDSRAGLPSGVRGPTLAAAGVVGAGAVVGLAGQPWPVAVGGAGLAALGVVLTVIDLRTHRLPDRLVGPGVCWLLLTLTLAAAVTGQPGALGRAVLGGLASAVGYLLLGLARAGGLGLGDVKLSGLLGLWLGWFGWSAVLAGPVAAFILGGLFASGLLIAGRAGRKSDFAFGPWMLLGAAVATAGSLAGALPY